MRLGLQAATRGRGRGSGRLCPGKGCGRRENRGTVLQPSRRLVVERTWNGLRLGRLPLTHANLKGRGSEGQSRRTVLAAAASPGGAGGEGTAPAAVEPGRV